MYLGMERIYLSISDLYLSQTRILATFNRRASYLSL